VTHRIVKQYKLATKLGQHVLGGIYCLTILHAIHIQFTRKKFYKSER